MTELPSQVNSALKRLEDKGCEAYIVGGCVRDSILGLAPTDYDITTSALPEQVKQVFAAEHVIETGLKHGTVTVVLEGMPVEITTFRADGKYSDNRRPDTVRFTASLEEDLSRRDFTMNAIAYNPRTGTVDVFGGRDDIRKGIIRCVGNADARFKEDALRIMRALRFSASLGFEIDGKTKKAAFANKELLKNISSERIYTELTKLLCGKNVCRVLTDYAVILGVPLPEILPMIGFDQRNPHHIYDLMEHTAHVVGNTPPTPLLRLTALLHDIGKPSAFTIDNSGVGHFHGHGAKGSDMAKQILNRLHTDNDTCRKAVTLIRCHDDRIECSRKAVRRMLNKLTPPMFFMLLDIKRADNMAQNIAVFNHLDEYAELERLANEIIEQKQCFSLKDLALNGNDMIQMGFEGKEIGRLLELLLDAVIDGKADNQRDALIAYLRRHPLYHS